MKNPDCVWCKKMLSRGWSGTAHTFTCHNEKCLKCGLSDQRTPKIVKIKTGPCAG